MNKKHASDTWYDVSLDTVMRHSLLIYGLEPQTPHIVLTFKRNVTQDQHTIANFELWFQNWRNIQCAVTFKSLVKYKHKIAGKNNTSGHGILIFSNFFFSGHICFFFCFSLLVAFNIYLISCIIIIQFDHFHGYVL